MHQHYIYIDDIDPYRAHVVSFDRHGQIVQNRDSVVLSTLNNANNLDHIHSTGADAYLILSDHLVSAYELDIKAKNRQQLEKAASFAIEDILPLEIEDYHIVTQKNESGGASIRCIPNSRLERLIGNCEKLGINVRGLTIETDLLNQQRSTLLIKQENTSLKTPYSSEVFDFDNNLLPLLSERIFPILNNENELDVIFSPDKQMLVETISTQAPESIRLRQIHRDQNYYEQLATRCKSKHAINLLQGKYASTSIESSEKNYWLFPSLLALFSGLLFTGGLVAQNLYLDKQVHEQEQKLIQAYSKRFPNNRLPRNVNDVVSRLKSKLPKNNQTNPTVISDLVLLESIAASSKEYNIQLVGLTIEANQCDLVINANNVEDINQYKNALNTNLEKLGSPNVEQISVNAKDQKYQGKFKIKF